MDQRVPQFDLVAHEGPMVCDFCHEEVTFLVGITQTETALDGNHCKGCFHRHKPEFTDSITDFSDLLDAFLELKAQKMTVEEMHELYGDKTSPAEEETDDRDEDRDDGRDGDTQEG